MTIVLPRRRKSHSGHSDAMAGHRTVLAGARRDYTPLWYTGRVAQWFQPGICKVCQLAPCEREWFESLYAGRKRLPNGILRRAGVNRRGWYRHRHGLCRGRVPYWQPGEWQRRKQSAKMIRRWQWRPGVSGNIRGRPKGAKDKRPRRKPNGIFAAIRAEREERAEQFRRQKLAAMMGAEE